MLPAVVLWQLPQADRQIVRRSPRSLPDVVTLEPRLVVQKKVPGRCRLEKEVPVRVRREQQIGALDRLELRIATEHDQNGRRLAEEDRRRIQVDLHVPARLVGSLERGEQSIERVEHLPLVRERFRHDRRQPGGDRRLEIREPRLGRPALPEKHRAGIEVDAGRQLEVKNAVERVVRPEPGDRHHGSSREVRPVFPALDLRMVDHDSVVIGRVEPGPPGIFDLGVNRARGDDEPQQDESPSHA